MGNWDGELNYMENTGTSTAPAFVQRSGSANPFDGIDVGGLSAPALADLDIGVRSTPALADLDNDGTLRPRPSTD